MKDKTKTTNRRRFKYGGYATILVIVVIAAVVLVNVGVSALTDSLNLELDLTRNSKYTLSNLGKTIAERVDKPVVIYAMFSETLKDNYPDYVKLFDNFAKASENITVEYVDPTSNPTFANQFLGGTVSSISAGSIIVSRADLSKFKILTSYDLYDYTYDSSYNVKATAFKGEDAVANALLYVNSEQSPRVYWYSGHGEVDIYKYSAMQSYLQKENFECATVDSVGLSGLEAGDTLVITAPQRDITTDELEQLKNFMSGGGRMVYLSSPGIELPNFEELIALYGVGFNRDLVLEGSASNYLYSPVMIVPTLANHDVTSTLRTNSMSAYMANSHSLYALDLKTSNLTVEALLTTSDSSYGKVDLTSTAVEKEAADTSGPFTLAYAAQMDATSSGGQKSQLVVFGSNAFATSYYSQGGNADLFLQAIRWMQDEETEVVTIVGKSMLEDRLSFTSYAQLYTAAGIAVIAIPLIIIISGIVVWLRRRHL